MRRHQRKLRTAAGISLALASASAFGLEPADVAVIFNTRSNNSLQVARYYLNARHLPMNRLLPVTCDAAENITEADYRNLIVPQLLKDLRDRNLLPDAKAGVPGIKCLVTTYDVPLRILAHEPTAPEKAEIADYQAQLDEAVADIQSRIARYDLIAPSTPASAPASRPTTTATTSPASASAPAPKPTWQQLVPKVQDAANAAARRIDRLGEPQRSRATELYIAVQEHMGGTSAILRSISVPADAPDADAGRKHLADLAAELKADQEQILALAPQKDTPRVRREIITLRLRAEGVIGQARALEETIAYLRPDQTSACFDNELALLLTDQGYPRANWVTNPKCLDAYPQYLRQGLSTMPPTLLISRIDGLTVAKAQELVATALQVEEKGLDGKLYLDARGLRGADAYAAFDADLRKTADWMRAHSTLDTVLDDNPGLFLAKDAPDAALYCGWYSLRQYQDSCQWVKGAVGYHVASLEMLSLHDPKETGWVPNLLAHGFAGTTGPIDEPYLHSFPKPSQFFPLLASGEFTQGEVWQLTCPLLSWRQGYVGDPLYNPFKAKPRVKIEDLKSDPILRNAFQLLGR